MVYFMERADLKWMRTRGSPMTQEPRNLDLFPQSAVGKPQEFMEIFP
jgi:hypothetical protein